LADNDIDLAANGAATTACGQALANWTDADTLKEQKREERDNLLTPIIDHLRGIGDVAVKWYATEPKRAGSLGFEIDDSPQAIKTKNVVIKEGEKKTIHDAVLDSIMKNKSSFDLLVHKGKTISASPIVLQAGTSMKLEAGFSTFIIENTHLDATGTVEVSLHK